jgi:hypothetical protein
VARYCGIATRSRAPSTCACDPCVADKPIPVGASYAQQSACQTRGYSEAPASLLFAAAGLLLGAAMFLQVLHDLVSGSLQHPQVGPILVIPSL